MKTKGTSVWEQYIEYVVLAVAIAVMGWFAWGAFGSKIEYKQGRLTLQAGTVNEELLDAAKSLEQKIKDNTPSPISIPVPDPIFDKFARQASQDVAPKYRVMFPTIDMTAALDANQDVQTELREYVSPRVPSPNDMKVQQWFGTIKKSVVDETEGLDAIVGPPFDTQWIQIAGAVHIDEIIESYAATDGLAAIPNRWYDGAIDIFDVEIERQRKTETGWSDTEIISPLQGHLSYRLQLADQSIDAIERDEIVRALRTGKQGEIVKPDFYPLKGFTPPDLDNPAAWGSEVETEKTPMQILKENLKEAEEDIENQLKAIEKINEDIRDAESGGDSGGGGRGGGGRGGGGDNKKVERLRRKLVSAEETLGELVDAKEAIEAEIEELNTANSSESGESVMEGSVWIWGHDTSVVPGETYRYRMLIQLANPFFGHKPSLYQRQHELAETVALSSERSEWTDPIEVQEMRQWVVTKAKTANSLSGDNLFEHSYISIDVFEFTDGMWSSKSSDIHVGEPITVDDSGENLGWFVLDVVEDVQGIVALLQNVKTEQLITKRPDQDVKSAQYDYLLQLIRDQSSAEIDDGSGDDSGTTPPGGGGGIGGGRGGGGGIGGGRGGGGRGGGGGRQ